MRLNRVALTVLFLFTAGGYVRAQCTSPDGIDSADAAFSSLRMWTDLNHDGISQPDELQTLPRVQGICRERLVNARRAAADGLAGAG
jgi:hypothetical protein